MLSPNPNNVGILTEAKFVDFKLKVVHNKTN